MRLEEGWSPPTVEFPSLVIDGRLKMPETGDDQGAVNYIFYSVYTIVLHAEDTTEGEGGSVPAPVPGEAS